MRIRKNGKVSSSESSTPKNYTTRHSNHSSPDLLELDPNEEAAAIILSRVDTESYEKAIVCDTENILQRHVLPKSFIWNKPRAQLLRTLPRDIEDMHGVLNADTISPFDFSTTNHGPLGFGMFDMGGLQFDEVRGTKDDTIITTRHIGINGESDLLVSPSRRKTKDLSSDDFDQNAWEYPLKCCNNSYEAAARRSDDPGVIEFTVKLPPLKLETALLNCQRHHILPQDPWLNHDKDSIQKAKALITAERAEFSSSMPFYWEKLDKKSYVQPIAFFDDANINDDDPESSYQTCLDDVGTTKKDKEEMYTIFKQRQERKLKVAKVAQSCFRKWRLSVKVGGVSSRKTLINVQNKASQPMHLSATFPTYYQSGKSMSLEAAQKMDQESNFYLGSFDCRASAVNASMSYQAMKNVKKENRTKKNINVGRTRLIWSSFHQAGNNKIVCTSNLTCTKLDAASAKRPLQAQVFIRLNGKIISIPESNTLDGKRDEAKEKVQRWQEKDINDAIEYSLKDSKINQDHQEITTSKKNHAYCTIDPEVYIQELAKKMKPAVATASKKRKSEFGHKAASIESTHMTFQHVSGALKVTHATLNCLPLDDGYFRVICETPGEIQATPEIVHELLTMSSTTGNEPMCSVCWSKDEKFKVQTCLDCGLNVHKHCCADDGEEIHIMKSTNNVSSWRCSVCKFATIIEQDASSNNYFSKNNNGDFDETLLPSRKSRRTSRLPTRFTQNTQIELSTLLRQTNTQETANDDSDMKQSRPSPRCVFCPFSGALLFVFVIIVFSMLSIFVTSFLCLFVCLFFKYQLIGGAMSPINGICNNGCTQWTHEICRIWSTKRTHQEVSSVMGKTCPSDSLTSIPFNSPLKESNSIQNDHNVEEMKRQPIRQICCLCGHGENVINLKRKYKGLIKCAAIGCHVMFHPMCAVLVSKSSCMEGSKQQQIKKDSIQEDIELCTQYTLELLEVKHEKVQCYQGDEKVKDSLFMVRGGGNSFDEKIMETSIVPIGLCGIHNPYRKKTFYGCTPGAKTMADYIRIPYQS